MYAIISDSGRQYKVREGAELDVDFRNLETGQEITFENVLAYRDEEGLKIGQPHLTEAKVVGEVVADSYGPKLVVQKFRRRKNSRTKTGHRQRYTRVKISKISLG